MSTIQTEEILETMHVNVPVEICAKNLKSECKTFEFGLNNSFRYATDLEIGMDKLHSAVETLESWNKFYNIFPSRSTSESITRKCDMIFQVFYNMVNGGQPKTPIHTVIAQCIHDTCKSKPLINYLTDRSCALAMTRSNKLMWPKQNNESTL